MKSKKTARRLLSAAAAILLVTVLSTCSGMFGPYTGVLIEIPELVDDSGGLYVTPDATQGYVVVAQANKIYSANEFTGLGYNYLVNGRVYISNLPVGDYVFGVVLLDATDDINGLAIKEVSIAQGFNEVRITMGPGFGTFSVGSIGLIDNPLVPTADFSSSFANDTMTIDYARPVTPESVTFTPTFGSGGRTISSTTAIQLGGAGDGANLGTTSPTVPADADGVRFDILDSGGDNYSYSLYLQ